MQLTEKEQARRAALIGIIIKARTDSLLLQRTNSFGTTEAAINVSKSEDALRLEDEKFYRRLRSYKKVLSNFPPGFISSLEHLMFSMRLSLSFIFFVVIAGCGGGGGASTPTPASKLFVADAANAGIGSIVNSNPSPGTMVVDRTIFGSNTSLTGYWLAGLARDVTNDRLYVANVPSILVFNSASTANGNVAPSRIISNVVDQTSALFIDTVHDVLYAANGINGAYAYDGASTASLVTQSRTITTTQLSGVLGIAVDVNRNILYTLSITNSSGVAYMVNAFNNASTINGTIAPDRAIAIGTSALDCGLFLDAVNDRLYVSTNNGHILVYNNASTANGAVTPDRDITLPVASPTKIAVDPVNNRLYAVTPSALYIINNASSVNGTATATQLTVNFATNFSGIAVDP